MKKQKNYILEKEAKALGEYRKIVEATQKSLMEQDPSALEEALGESTPLKKRFVENITSAETAHNARIRLFEVEQSKDSQDMLYLLKKKAQQRQRLLYLRIAGSAAAAILITLGILRLFPPQETPIPEYATPTLLTEAIPTNPPQGLTIVRTNQLPPIALPQGEKDDAIHWQTLVVPHGHTYTVTLSDSSLVTLNANSKLYYPNTFGGEKREVYLSGEGYFQIAKTTKPFIVQTSHGAIRVYGTTFNVYQRDSLLETILVKGSVGVSIPSLKEIRLEPSMRLYHKLGNKEARVEHIKASQYLGWIEGIFYYDNAPVKRLFADLSDWYGVTFEYTPAFGEELISLKLDKKSQHIEDILGFLESVLNKRIVTQTERRYIITEKEP